MNQDFSKISPEQLQLLQKKILEAQGGSLRNNQKQKLQKKFSFREFLKFLHPKVLFMLVIKGMDRSVKYIDSLIKFITKKNVDARENVVHHARPPILFGTFIIVFFVGSGFIWSVTAPLDSASVAIGSLVSLSKRQIINHPEGGIIKNVFVKLGDEVKKGDKLLELEDRRISLHYNNALTKFRTYSAAQDRIVAEIKHLLEVEYNDNLKNDWQEEEVEKIIEIQNELFSSRVDLYKNTIDTNEESIKITKKNIEVLKNNQLALDQKLGFINKRLKNTKELEKKGFAQTIQISELEAEYVTAKVGADNNKTEIIKLEQEVIKKKLELAHQLNDWNVRLYQELKENQQNLFASQEEFNSFSHAMQELVLKSPINGSVNQIIYYTKGQHVPPSQPIIEITPLNEELIIEAHIRNKDIDSVKVGQKSKIRFSAFKSRTSPLFTGTVVSISPDIVSRRGDEMSMGGKKMQEEPSYIAEIELDIEEFAKIAKKRKFKLYPGMSAEVQIVTGSRTLLQYLLDPVLDAAFKGLKEK